MYLGETEYNWNSSAKRTLIKYDLHNPFDN